MQGNDNIILKGVGGFYSLYTPFGIVTAKPRGLFRDKGEKPIAGDFCVIEPSENGEGFTHVITEILPRKNRFVRPPVANVERMFLVASTIEPRSSPFQLDTMIATGVYLGVEVILIITKSDIKKDKNLAEIYNTTSHKVLVAGEKDNEIFTLAKGKISVLAGNTGVGKSTLMNRLYGTDRPTAPISKKLGRGVHTTREAELLPLSGGGFFADTAGFSSLSFSMMCDAEVQHLADLFLEFSPFAKTCRFADCSHRKEDGCEVRRAMEDGAIHNSRYNSYLKIYDEVEKKGSVYAKV